MATVKAVNYTKGDDPYGSNLMEANLQYGKVRYIYDKYEAASLAGASVIKMARLPKGAVVLPNSCIVHDALGSGVTLAVGDNDDTDADDADRYLEATSAASAGVIQFNDDATCIDKMPYKVQKDCDLTITTANEATGTIEVHLLIAVE
ncbi:MAG: hypothetical protein AVO39_10320 [delta proteobacterium MLS_D]|jgi:hypothetical protein|nr:MAG: hypothetical protein AVO39_10320 [delta proteobacterium MLS_D]